MALFFEQTGVVAAPLDFSSWTHLEDELPQFIQKKRYETAALTYQCVAAG
jgi:hypothetical protein